MNSYVGPYSIIQKLYGDPDQYAYKFGNNTFANALPIHLNWLYKQLYDFYHAVSIDCDTQKVYYSNNLLEQLEFGYYISNSNKKRYIFHAAPDTNQVTNIYEPL